MRLKVPRRLASLLVDPAALQKLVFPGLFTAKPKAKPRSNPKPRPVSKPRAATSQRLVEVTGFGRNPGNLRMLEYVPEAKTAAALPLVVVLHGCQQNAADFDAAAGWTALAKANGFAVLYPEQKPSNNGNLCFNWFRPSSVARDRGEIGSIREMIVFARKRHAIDDGRIFVVGLSAGGAMAAALLATYPDMFTAGAIVGGLPFGSARDAMSALSVMKTAARRGSKEWADLVRLASPGAARFPAVSIWHGDADPVVSFSNAEASVAQWLGVHGVSPNAGPTDRAIERGSRRQWLDGDGRPVVELVSLEGFGHGMPIGPKVKKRPANQTERFMLPSAHSAAHELVKSWKIGRL
jgi:poly(hydroxyalkanoate) depolymerase family esterase